MSNTIIKPGTTNTEIAAFIQSWLSKHDLRRLGADSFALKMKDQLQELFLAGNSLNQIRKILNETGVPTARGKTWTSTAVGNCLRRLNRIEGDKQKEVNLSERD